MKRTIRVIALALLCLPASAFSQEEPAPVAAPVADAAPVQPATAEPASAAPIGPERPSDSIVRERTILDKDEPGKTDVTLGLRTHVGAGLGLAGPLGAAARLSLLQGLGADVREDGVRVNAVCAIPIPHCAKGILMQVDAGTGGGKLSLGVGAYAKVHEESFKGTAGVALRMAVAHTWGDPVGTAPGLTYVGPELDLSILRVTLTMGTLFRVAGNGGKGMLFSWGLGFGS